MCSFFFFSSRRRHTRFKCDWSSDVCSSDLIELEIGLPALPPEEFHGDDVFMKPAHVGRSPSREAVNQTRVDGIDLARGDAFLLALEGKFVDLDDKIAFLQEGEIILDRMDALEPEDVFQFCGRHPAGKVGD